MPGWEPPGPSGGGASLLRPATRRASRGDPVTSPAEDEAQAPLVSHLRVIAARRYEILATFALGVAIAAVAGHVMTPIYRATALVVVEDEAARLAGVRGAYPADRNQDRYYGTQCRLIRSRTVLAAAAERLQLGRREGFAGGDPVSALDALVSVEHLSDTKLIEVSVDGPDPKEAARFANVVVDCFRGESMRRRQRSSDSATGWIARQLPVVSDELAAAERRLQEFQETNRILSPDADRALVSQQMRLLSEDVAAAERERIELEAGAAAARAALDDPLAAEFLPLVSESRSIRGLDAQTLELEKERSALLQSAMPDHRDVKALDARLADLEASRRQRVAAAVSAMEKRLDAARAKESSLRAALAEREKDALALGEKLIRMDALRRGVERAKQVYEPMLRRREELDRTSGLEVVPVEIWDRAEAPRAPVRPRRVLLIVVGALLGLVAGVNLAFLLELAHTRLRTPEQLESRIGLKSLGAVPHMAARDERARSLACHLDPRSRAAEAFRGIRTALLASTARNGPAVLLVTSAVDREGKTTTAVNVATAMAQAGRRVLLVDADMRRPSVHGPFGIPDGPGLSSLLADAAPPAGAVRESEVPGLSVLPAGTPPANPSELLGSPRMVEFLTWARGEFDLVVVDSPPATVVTDAAVLAPAVDAAVLVVRADRTPRGVAARGRQVLEDAGGRIAGAVLNDLARDDDTYGRAYGRYYREGAGVGPEA